MIRDFKNILAYLCCFSALFAMSCENKEVTSGLPASGDYFPLKDGTLWIYNTDFLGREDSSFQGSELSLLRVSGDTVINGVSYKQILDHRGWITMVIRKEGANYYGMNHQFYSGFRDEYLFLNTSAAVGESWTHFKSDSLFKTEYLVSAVNQPEWIGETKYQDVIKLDVNYYYKEESEYILTHSSKHWYAKNIGEVYATYPYSRSRFGSWDKVSLFKYSLK